MVSPDQTPEGWTAVTQAYVEHLVPQFTRFAEDALDLVDLQPGERLLDVAAGPGTLSIPAAKRGAAVLATDFSPAMIDELRRRAESLGASLEVAWMDGQDLQVEPGSFDVACSCLGVMMFPDRAAGFRGLHRALRPGGRCAVVAWGPPQANEWFSILVGTLQRVTNAPPPPGPPPPFSLADPAVLESEMRDAGFVDVRVEQVTHRWEQPSPEAAWTALTTTNPVAPSLMARLDPEARERVHRGVVEAFAGRVVDGRVVVQAMANIGLGTA